LQEPDPAWRAGGGGTLGRLGPPSSGGKRRRRRYSESEEYDSDSDTDRNESSRTESSNQLDQDRFNPLRYRTQFNL